MCCADPNGKALHYTLQVHKRCFPSNALHRHDFRVTPCQGQSVKTTHSLDSRHVGSYVGHGYQQVQRTCSTPPVAEYANACATQMMENIRQHSAQLHRSRAEQRLMTSPAVSCALASIHKMDTTHATSCPALRRTACTWQWRRFKRGIGVRVSRLCVS